MDVDLSLCVSRRGGNAPVVVVLLRIGGYVVIWLILGVKVGSASSLEPNLFA